MKVDDGTRETLRCRRPTPCVRSGISRKAKSVTKCRKESDEAIVPMTAWTVQPYAGKGLCFNSAFVRR
jgi:hypothetical protein